MIVNRREFFLRPARKAGRVELSCERLYMKYVDAQADGRVAHLMAALGRELTSAGELRLRDADWLARDDLRRDLEPVFRAFEARGGRIL